MKKATLSFVGILSLLFAIISCKKNPSSYELINGRWYSKSMTTHQSYLINGVPTIEDTTYNYTNGEYLTFLSSGQLITHKGNDLYDTATYNISGDYLTVFSKSNTGGSTIYDTTKLNIQALNESVLTLYNRQDFAPGVFFESTIKLER